MWTQSSCVIFLWRDLPVFPFKMTKVVQTQRDHSALLCRRLCCPLDQVGAITGKTDRATQSTGGGAGEVGVEVS